MRRRKPKKEFAGTWIFEAFDREPSFFQKRMFGCLAAYYRGRMVMVLAEDPGDQTYRGRKYKFDIWDGILLPVAREDHASLTKDFKGLVPHPVLGKWLYLPQTHPDFESTVRKIAERIAAGDPRLGIEPAVKRP